MDLKGGSDWPMPGEISRDLESLDLNGAMSCRRPPLRTLLEAMRIFQEG